jgi:hypothetical protein
MGIRNLEPEQNLPSNLLLYLSFVSCIIFFCSPGVCCESALIVAQHIRVHQLEDFRSTKGNRAQTQGENEINVVTQNHLYVSMGGFA